MHPALTALMSREPPDDVQGGIGRLIVSPSIACFLAGVMLALTLAFFLSLKEPKPVTPR